MAAAVGILAAHCCHFKGAKKIIMVDSVPARLEVGLPVAKPTAALPQQHPDVLPSRLLPVVWQHVCRRVTSDCLGLPNDTHQPGTVGKLQDLQGLLNGWYLVSCSS